jgi:hypothetical protein
MSCVFYVKPLHCKYTQVLREVNIAFHWGRNIQTLPRAHKCLVALLLRRISEAKRQEARGNCRKLHTGSFILRTLHQMLLR